MDCQIVKKVFILKIDAPQCHWFIIAFPITSVSHFRSLPYTTFLDTCVFKAWRYSTVPDEPALFLKGAPQAVVFGKYGNGYLQIIQNENSLVLESIFLGAP